MARKKKGKGHARTEAPKTQARPMISSVQQSSMASRNWLAFSAQQGALYSSFTTRKMTMAQEARNTERHGRERHIEVQLRKKPVGFVAANSQDEPSDNDSSPVAKRNEEFMHAPSTLTQTTRSEGRLLPIEGSSSYEQTENPENSMSDAIEHLVIENAGSLRREQSLCSSSDSDDIVVFQGRGNPLRQVPEECRDSIQEGAVEIAHKDDVEMIKDNCENDFSTASNLHVPPIFSKPSNATEVDVTALPQRHPRTLDPEQGDVVIEPMEISDTFRKRSQRRLEKWQAEEEAILQDYIENMASESSETDAAPGDSAVKQSYSWDSTDLDDFRDLSTSEEEMDSVQCVLARRERQSGVQYLVYAENQSPDEARWISVAHLQHVSTLLNNFDEAEARKLEEAGTNRSSDNDSSDQEMRNDLLDDIESEEDEQKAVRDRVARMTDSQIALALAKQEELGLPADEVLIYDGVFDNEGDETDTYDDDTDIDTDDAAFRRHRNTNSKLPKPHFKKDHRSDGYPSAMAFADALEEDPYGAFDIMDFERPSLKPKSKGRKGQVDMLGLEDEDLKAQIQESWNNDREKKKTKKLERQQLRELGLLGQKNGRVDMAAKYPHGMQRHHIKAEIKAFLLSPLQSIAFPPMHAQLRATLHHLASKVGVASKSQGSGNSRFPVLTKTKSTPSCDSLWPEDVDELFASVRGGKGQASGKRGAKTPNPSRHRKGGGGVKAGAFYLEGEVVGAAAPEIGVDNRGRAMLEKMGWTSGTALGTQDNKGILQPVAHVVKNSKAGLR